MQSTINSFHHILCPEVKRCGVSGGKNENRGPRVPIFALINLGTKCRHRPRSYILAESGSPVVTANRTVGSAQIDDVRILGIGRHVSTLAPARGKPITRGDLIVIGTAGHGSASAILLRAVHDVGKLVVGDDMIELCSGLVVPRAPGPAAVQADCSALIRSQNHAVGIPGIDPYLMVIVPARRAPDN